MWGHHQPDVSDHPEHDGDAPDGVVAVPLLLLGHQDEPEVGQDVGAQHLSVVYLPCLFSCAQSAVTHNSVASVNWFGETRVTVIACSIRATCVMNF